MLAMLLGTEGGTSAVLFEKSAQRLVESPVKRAFLSIIQADLCITSFSRCVMPGCIRHRSIGGPNRDDRHSFPIEMKPPQAKSENQHYRKLQIPPIIEKSNLQ